VLTAKCESAKSHLNDRSAIDFWIAIME